MSERPDLDFGYRFGAWREPNRHAPIRLYADNRYWPDRPPPHREMTADDLGLPLPWNADHLGEAYWDFVFGRRKPPEAPYTFWLGADDGEDKW